MRNGKPLKMILSVPPGAALDASARLLAEKLRVSLDRPIVIDYKVGGIGLSAGEFLKTTEPDGSYLLFTPSSFFAYHPFLYSKLTYDPDKDLLPVCEGLTIPTAITVSSASGIATFKDWVEAVRRDPKMRFVGTPGLRASACSSRCRWARLSASTCRSCPTRAAGPLQTDLLGGQVPASASVIADYLELHRAGRLRILAQSSNTRSPLAPDIPSFTELGYPDSSARPRSGSSCARARLRPS